MVGVCLGSAQKGQWSELFAVPAGRHPEPEEVIAHPHLPALLALRHLLLGFLLRCGLGQHGLGAGVGLGTGCGGGITMLRNIHRGANRIAGEWGHHCLVPGGRECYCGNRGCTEAYISGTALEKEWFELSGEKSRVTDIIDNGKNKNHPEWKENFLKNFGRGLANVIDILDPHAIVIGGGLSRIDFLYTEGKESVYKETFSKIVRTPILKNK